MVTRPSAGPPARLRNTCLQPRGTLPVLPPRNSLLLAFEQGHRADLKDHAGNRKADEPRAWKDFPNALQSVAFKNVAAHHQREVTAVADEEKRERREEASEERQRQGSPEPSAAQVEQTGAGQRHVQPACQTQVLARGRKRRRS